MPLFQAHSIAGIQGLGGCRESAGGCPQLPRGCPQVLSTRPPPPASQQVHMSNPPLDSKPYDFLFCDQPERNLLLKDFLN